MTRMPRILVVDDEAHILHVVSLKLRNAGYEVITAADGEEGLALAIEQRPDLLITDFQMPYMNGIELCARLKADERTADLPAIMLTAHGFSLSNQQTENTNIAAIISKPFSPRQILIQVQELIGRRDRAPETA